MSRGSENDTPTAEALKLRDSQTPAGDIQLRVLEASDSDTSTASSASEDQTYVDRPNSSSKSSVEKIQESKPAAAPPTKVLFLDGVRGLAAILVVTQHSKEYMQGLNLGAVAVDAFFVLSSFLLTWLFMKKSMKLLAQGAGVRSWGFALVDYFSKRFFRVYPLFALTAIVVSCMSFENQHRYFLVKTPGEFGLDQVLTFEFNHRQFVLWTLPLEISYYFVIPVFVLAILGMRRYWWVAVASLSLWVVYEGVTEYRTSHTPLGPHIPTFLSGSLAAVVFVKLDLWILKTGFEFRWWHTLLLRAAEGVTIAVLLSVCFKGLFFDWVHANPVPAAKGFPFVSALLTTIFVIEMLRPSCVSTMFEWSVLRYWGKISFSVYLLHSFVIWNPTISAQPKFFNRLFARVFLILLLATASYQLVERPSQLLAQRISRFLAAREAKGPSGLGRFGCMERITMRKRRAGVEMKN
ncbi:Acyltransferase family [Phytophthora cinnamomi]|uniref:Acyltransferase family n=1 Tax=Phytophthora cinnamomi TaxID=4785 RepID=UPI00355A2544|nr:Acyltransferase family [Phytophthora cinnamomi]